MIDVRFGSKADMCSAKRHVRFAPESDRESGHPQRIMSALPLKADMCDAKPNVRFGPIADIERNYSITSSAATSSPAGIFIPIALAALILTEVSNLVGDC